MSATCGKKSPSLLSVAYLVEFFFCYILNFYIDAGRRNQLNRSLYLPILPSQKETIVLMSRYNGVLTLDSQLLIYKLCLGP